MKSITRHLPKLMFLDIDGVIASEKTNLIHKTWPHSGPGGTVVDGHAFDPCAIALINKILEDNESYKHLYLVLSSTWREYTNIETVETLLKNIGINTDKFIGMTPILKGVKYGGWSAITMGDGVRGDEIEYFLRRIRSEEGVEQLRKEGLIMPRLQGGILFDTYVIIDDVPTAALEKHKKSLVLTDEAEGFGYRDYLNTCAVLDGVRRPEWVMRAARQVLDINLTAEDD